MTRFIHIWLVLGLGLLTVHLPACNVEGGSNAVAAVPPAPSAAVTQAASEAVAPAVHAGEVVADGNVEMYY
ncbi:MAG TPA: hypothetical protein VFC18_20065 [Burkholderiales bacterium]|nr:hypothetical protein [Burkholderiales bacterium]